jgi:hypothetical protein
MPKASKAIKRNIKCVFPLSGIKEKDFFSIIIKDYLPKKIQKRNPAQ